MYLGGLSFGSRASIQLGQDKLCIEGGHTTGRKVEPQLQTNDDLATGAKKSSPQSRVKGLATGQQKICRGELQIEGELITEQKYIGYKIVSRQ